MPACAPERGNSTPTLSAPPCARTIAGAASAAAAVPASSARRVRRVFIEFLPRFGANLEVRGHVGQVLLCLIPYLPDGRTTPHAAKRRSIPAAISNRRRSWPLRATSINPTGNPEPGMGSEIAHMSKKFHVDVLRKRSMFLVPNVLESCISAIVGAAIGVVGSTHASN